MASARGDNMQGTDFIVGGLESGYVPEAAASGGDLTVYVGR